MSNFLSPIGGSWLLNSSPSTICDGGSQEP